MFLRKFGEFILNYTVSQRRNT